MVASLQRLCSVKVAIVISNLADVKKQIFFSSEFPPKRYSKYSRWRLALIRLVTKRLKSYPLRFVGIIPIYLVPLIGLQMLKWAKFLESYFGLTMKFCCEFIKSSLFTSCGTIDESKAARELVKESSISPFLQYKIASYYFLADDLPILWKQLRHELNSKERLRNTSPYEPDIMWSEHLEEKEALSTSSASDLNSVMDRFLMKAFVYGIDKENFEAIKYCWKTMRMSKRILNYEDKTIAQNEERVYLSVYDGDWLSKYNDAIGYPTYSHLLSKNLEVCTKMLEFFVLQMNKEEIKELLNHFEASLIVLKCFLHWPYQYLFMGTVDAVFQSLSGDDYYGLLHSIVDLIEDPDIGQTWDYRLLLKEFWARSPSHLCQHVINIECRCFRSSSAVKPLFTPKYKLRPIFLLQKLIFLSTFSSDDESNFRLILEKATIQDKTDVLNFQGKDICYELILFDNFRLADMFLECLTLNGETLKTFKINLAWGIFLDVMKRENIDLADQFVNWIVRCDEIENLKEEIFSDVFKISTIVHWITIFKTSINFLNKLFKWFLYTDHKIEEWKKNIIFDENFSRDFVLGYNESQRLDEVLEWLSYGKDKVSNIKMEILLKALPDIVEQLLAVYLKVTREAISINCILYLCSKKTQLIDKFVKSLHSLCKDYVEERKCVFCRDNEHVYFDEIEAEFYCNSHYQKILSLEDFNIIYSPLKELDDIIAGHEK